jgi:hypothetical protein
MTKATNAIRKSRTHFEQIPLELVKTVTPGEVPKKRKTGTDNLVEPVSKRTKP